MDAIKQKVCWGAALLLLSFVCGCQQQGSVGKGQKQFTSPPELGPAIGSLAEVVVPGSIAVEGYGLAGNLNGTGSSQCPPQVRAYLTRYILSQLSGQKIDVNKLIDSPDTAVVLIQGILPLIPSKDQFFDVQVTALQGTSTTSLEGGWLYTAELKAVGLGLNARAIADVEGPVFIDTVGDSQPDKKAGFILAGGRVLDNFTIGLVLREPDYRVTSDIRNRLNGLFGDGVAKAVSPSRIEVIVPDRYKEQRERFASLVRSTYLTYTPEVTEKRVSTFARLLDTSQDKEASEIALEAIGTDSIGMLNVLLNSTDQQVRLRAARCMLNLSNNAGLNVLQQMAFDTGSPYRVEALEAITLGAARVDAAVVSRKLLLDRDFQVCLAAYEQLRKLDDVALKREFIGRSFYLEQVSQTGHRVIFVSRSGQPRIVLFGAPIYCRDNIFVQSSDGGIIINAPTGQKYVTLARKHPKRPGVVAQARSSFELADIIRKLCEEPARSSEETRRGGLGVSYAEMIALLKQLSDKGAVRAQFLAGPLAKIDTTIKK
jgi:hypothetical protein